jgi:hypothetical protein
MKLPIRLLCFVTVITDIGSAQHAGDIPPALVWNKLKGSCPVSLDWKNLRGEVVIVSLSPDDVFDIDDWKEAAKPFLGKPVQFIQVVGGSEFVLDQALRQTGYQGCVLLDADVRNHKNFKLPLSRRVSL